MTKDDECRYPIGDIAEYTAQHSPYLLNNLSSRNQTVINNMAEDNLDKEGFMKATHAEILAVFRIGTFGPNEKLPEKIDKKLIGPSKMLYAKKYHPDGSFNKFKACRVFRGDKWYNLYQKKT